MMDIWSDKVGTWACPGVQIQLSSSLKFYEAAKKKKKQMVYIVHATEVTERIRSWVQVETGSWAYSTRFLDLLSMRA